MAILKMLHVAQIQMESVVPVKSCEVFALPTWRSCSNASGPKGLYSDPLHSPLMFHQERGNTCSCKLLAAGSVAHHARILYTGRFGWCG